MEGAHLDKHRLAGVGGCGGCGDGLLLYVAFWLYSTVARRVKHLEEALDDRVEVGQERVTLDALAEFYERGGGVQVFAEGESVDSPKMGGGHLLRLRYYKNGNEDGEQLTGVLLRDDPLQIRTLVFPAYALTPGNQQST